MLSYLEKQLTPAESLRGIKNLQPAASPQLAGGEDVSGTLSSGRKAPAQADLTSSEASAEHHIKNETKHVPCSAAVLSRCVVSLGQGEDTKREGQQVVPDEAN